MNAKPDRAKAICDLYHKGITSGEIAKQYKMLPNGVKQVLKAWYPKFYGREYEKRVEKTDKKLKDLKAKFDEIYIPKKYKTVEMCKLLGCKGYEFMQMLNKYNIEYLRLQTYKNQKSLCNVPDVLKQEINEYANKLGISVRELAMRAICEYMLYHEEE